MSRLFASSRVNLPISTSQGGLRIPQLSVLLRQQRVSITQQYISSMVISAGLEWSTPAVISFYEALPLRGALLPLYLLNMSYHRHLSIVHMQLIPSWWRCS